MVGRLMTNTAPQTHAQHAGTPHWKWQRVSSLLLIPFTAWLLSVITHLAGADYGQALAFFSNPLQAWIAIAMTALVAFHAQTGIQVICEDYIPQPFQSLLIWLTRIGCLAGLVLMGWAMIGMSMGAAA